MTPARIVFLIAAIVETILAIPLLGGILVAGLSWTPLLVTLILHIVALVMSSQDSLTKTGPILGIVTSLIAWIPFLGWAMHVVTAVVYFIAVFGPKGPETEKDKETKVEEVIKDAEIVEEAPAAAAEVK